MFLTLGLNHQTAPLALREKVAFTKERLPEALSALNSVVQKEEVALLSTCNRTEIYAKSVNLERILNWFNQYFGMHPRDLEPHLYFFSDEKAVQHLLRVACGLDSMVLGEPQILGQLKEAYQLALTRGVLGKNLTKLFQFSFRTAKKVRSQTEIGRHPVSVAYAAVKLATQIFSQVNDSKILVIGAGETIELVLKHFKNLEIDNVMVANRSLKRATELAQNFGGDTFLLPQLPEYLPKADIIISSTASDHPLIDFQMAQKAFDQGRRKPVLMVDLAVPRDIDPKVNALEDVFLYAVDDLQNIVLDNQQAREEQAKLAEEIVAQEAKAYIKWVETQALSQWVCDFRSYGHRQKDQEVTRALDRLHSGHSPEEVIEELAHRLSQKLLHRPTTWLKKPVFPHLEVMLDLCPKKGLNQKK